MRPDEDAAAIEHVFVSEELFREHERAGAFLTVVSLFGLPHMYGLPSILPSGPNEISCCIVRAHLVPQVRRQAPGATVYSLDLPLSHGGRTRMESDSPEDGTRFTRATEELILGHRLADRIIQWQQDPDARYRCILEAIHQDFPGTRM